MNILKMVTDTEHVTIAIKLKVLHAHLIDIFTFDLGHSKC